MQTLHLWTANVYMVNPGGDAGKMCIPTLKRKDQEGCDVLAAPNEEKKYHPSLHPLP